MNEESVICPTRPQGPPSGVSEAHLKPHWLPQSNLGKITFWDAPTPESTRRSWEMQEM